MSHKKAGGSTALGRDSVAKRLGVKITGGDKARIGNVIIRQRGTKFHPGKNVLKGGDDTLLAAINGVVKFSRRKVKNFQGKLQLRTYVSIVAPEKK